MSQITSYTNTIHIGLLNHCNVFCHHLSIIQRLHASETINKNIDRIQYDPLLAGPKGDIGDILLAPLAVYKKLNTGELTSAEVNARIAKYFEWFGTEKYITQFNGYAPVHELYYFFLPAVYGKLGQDVFLQVIKELSLDVINFNLLEYEYKNRIICSDTNSYVAAEYRQQILEWYQALVKCLPEVIPKTQFVATTVEVFPEGSTWPAYGGHAVSLIRTNDDKLYIIDDNAAILPIETWYKQRKPRIREVFLRDIDEHTVNRISTMLHAIDGHRFESRVTKYVLSFDHKFETVPNQELKQEFNQVSGLTGGIRAKRKSLDQSNTLLNCIFVFLFLIVLVIAVTTVRDLSKVCKFDVQRARRKQ